MTTLDSARLCAEAVVGSATRRGSIESGRRSSWALVVKATALIELLAVAACTGGATSHDGEVLDQRSDFPCVLRVAPSGVELAADTLGIKPDPDVGVVRTADGGYLSTVKFGGQIAMWNRQGEYVRSFGRPGRGPGELAPGKTGIFLDPFDSVHVRDNSGAWSVFSRSGDFARRIPATHMGYLDRHTHLLKDGTILTTSSRAADDAGSYFNVADRDGNLIRSFGAVQSQRAQTVEVRDPDLVSTYDGGERFWVAEEVEAGSVYMLHQWTVSGQYLGMIKREVSWFRTPERTRAGGAPPPAEIWSLHVDSTGLILVYAIVPNGTWKSPTSPIEKETRSMVDVYYEVIDPDARIVLASSRVDDPLALPIRFFGTSRTGVRPRELPNGLQTQEVVSYRLERKAGQSDSRCR